MKKHINLQLLFFFLFSTSYLIGNPDYQDNLKPEVHQPAFALWIFRDLY